MTENKIKRLNLLRYGFIVVTAVAFALTAALVYIGSGQLGKALLQGALLAVGTAAFCAILYYLYKSYLAKSA